eukprot:1143438-Pelagomonas_calceolata.AAC.2
MHVPHKSDHHAHNAVTICTSAAAAAAAAAAAVCAALDPQVYLCMGGSHFYAAALQFSQHACPFADSDSSSRHRRCQGLCVPGRAATTLASLLAQTHPAITGLAIDSFIQ